ncbi:MAG: hypothetical protein JWO03_2969, partial [Bacteroidetes bacterium]|nr:hypothetical protein [Bacteroidota bacterium]
FNTNATDYGSIYCIFPYGLPITAGTYTVVPDGQVQTANQISFMLGVDQDPLDAYYSTGRNGTETVTVSVANGKVSIVGSGVELYADRDSSSLSLDLHQLN